MKKYTILIPVYNDWESLKKLLNNIDENINDIKDTEFSCVIINDASKNDSFEIKKFNNINSIEIITMQANRGHARCIAFGLRHLSKNNGLDYLIIMDGDGEDRPEEIKKLVEKSLAIESFSVVAKRVKRAEGIIFQALYQAHKLITLFFTGKMINFGNYSCLTKKDIKTLSDKPSLWSSFSGTFKKYINNFQTIDSIRGKRYFGPSKMSLTQLILHSFSIIAVFKSAVFTRSAITIFLVSFLGPLLGNYLIIIQILIVIFNILIFLISLRENKKSLLDSHFNIKSQKSLTH
jgi:polyisoprenyl-phosphate glycosyltransferase